MWKKPTKKQARARSRRRRQRIKKGSASNTPDDSKIIRVIYEACKRVTGCTGIPHHVDHIRPLCRGGKHTPGNLQILTARLNLKKRGRIAKKKN